MNEIHPILSSIIENRKVSVEKKKQEFPLEKLKANLSGILKHRNFFKALKQGSELSLIAECKKSTPIEGVIRENYNLTQIVSEYQSNKVSAISVLTEEKFFLGRIEDLKIVKESTTVPVLRKDFIIDKYQLYESLYYGADAVLLIKKILSYDSIKELFLLAKSLGLEVLVEVGDEKEIEEVLRLNPDIIGINNRDLSTFKVDITTTLKLRKYLPDDVCIVSESGIKSKGDIKLIKSVGVDAVLIGSYFMKSKSITEAIKCLEI